MTDVLGTEDARFALPSLPRSARWVAWALAVVLGAALLTVVRGLPTQSAFVVAADGLYRVQTDGRRTRLDVPEGQDPAKLLRLGRTTVLLTRPELRSSGGRAYRLVDGSFDLTDLGSADDLAPDSRGDRVWLVTGAARKTLVGVFASGRRSAPRHVVNPQRLLMVAPDGVLDDEVSEPGGSTPTFRGDTGTLIRRLPGPVQVLDVRGPRLLVTAGSCLDSCAAQVWDVRTGSTRTTALPRQLIVLDGALSSDGRSLALAARSTEAGDAMDGDQGEAVLLRAGVSALGRSVVRGGCTLLACHVTWRGDTVYASVDLTPGSFVRWGPRGAPQRLRLSIPDVQDLSGL